MQVYFGITIAPKEAVEHLGEFADTIENLKDMMKQSREFILNNSSVNVELETIASKNVADDVNNFVELRSVELAIVNPGIQGQMPGFLLSGSCDLGFPSF